MVLSDFPVGQVSFHVHLTDRQGPRKVICHPRHKKRRQKQACTCPGSESWYWLVWRPSSNSNVFKLSVDYDIICENHLLGIYQNNKHSKCFGTISRADTVQFLPVVSWHGLPHGGGMNMQTRSVWDFSFLFVDRFVFKNTGVLFETDILQVGIKSEFKEGKGKYKIIL